MSTTDLRRALAMEWLRMRTVRSSWVLAVVTLAVAGGEALLRAVDLGEIRDADDAAALVSGPQPSLTMLFLIALGALAWGHDHRYATHGLVLTVVPRRGALVVGRGLVLLATAVTIAAAAFGSAVFWATVGSGGDLLDHLGEPPMGRVAAAIVLLDVAGALFGLAVGCLVRSATAAMAVAIVVPVMVERLVALGADELVDGAERWFPFTAATRWTQVDPGDGALSFAMTHTVLFAVISGLLALAAIGTVRRDA